ncbi:hypothetical protein CF088_19190 [Clostridium botulinum]|uniref:Pycsar effector protein domain-containing protein n=1 Tax=Clostridium botulinum TaxID=1491 RepID=A0A846J6D1_CLOBO|nr:Pycsar system effector family protein [Clostridium botulinum]ACA57427.1 conserved hypothetical protein [Clostridium botulinum A3 str. Loch Maree]APH23570.1 hypothetical protein NPD1_3060 [Clostridium botulinum]APQ70092.1 hypothetical protein RSJ8_1186 [Clostridium botulinum]MBN3380748.1 hypothetical protein [Clostridium botulinum]MBN3407349.1 hypothetical protein [Clostridium botulinum]
MSQQSNYNREDAYKTLEIINLWIGNIDTKISFVLAFMAVLIGFIFTKGLPNSFQNVADKKLLELKGIDILGILIVLSLYCTSLISIIFFLFGIKGKVKDISNNQSIFFFGSIGGMDRVAYIEKINNMTEDEILNDLGEQIHINSKICSKKISYYNKGLLFLIVTVILCFICMVFQLV